MMAPEYYTFTGERVPDYVTHVRIAEALKFVPARAFYWHPNIEEVICHDGVVKIEREAFYSCPSLRRVIMPGVKEVERKAFNRCRRLTYIQCGRLERIGEYAFIFCEFLSSIDLPSINSVGIYAFECCINLTNVKFGKDLESIGTGVFLSCASLERITLPLKDRMIAFDNEFQGCDSLHHVDLAGGVHESVAALLLEEWKNDMNDKIDSINRILPNTPAGDWYAEGRISWEIRTWIRSVLHKYNNYKADHRRYLRVAAAALQPALPNDIVLKNIFPFIELPSFRGELGGTTHWAIYGPHDSVP